MAGRCKIRHASSHLPCFAPPVHKRSRTHTFAVHHAQNWCNHGREVTRLTTTQRHDGRWQLWGEFPCPYCERVLLAVFDEQPQRIAIAGRELPVYDR